MSKKLGLVKIIATNFGAAAFRSSDLRARSSNFYEHSSAEICGYSMLRVMRTSMNQLKFVTFA